MNEAWHWRTLGRIFSENRAEVTDQCAKLTVQQWKSVARFSVNQLVAPDLFCTMRDIGTLPLVPSDIAEGLEGAFELNALLHQDLLTTFADFVRVANAHGVTPMVLKGGIDIVSPSDTVNRARVVSDLDVLVGEDEADELYQCLLREGWRPDPGAAPDLDYVLSFSHHYPAIWHPRLRQYVELHVRLGPTPEDAGLLNELWSSENIREVDGREFAIPDLQRRLIHNAIHHFARNVRLNEQLPSFRQALDFFRLFRRLEAVGVFGPEICSLIGEVGASSSFRTSASLVNDVFLGSIVHKRLSDAEREAEAEFWACMESRQAKAAREVRVRTRQQLRRARNWRKLLSRPFWRHRLSRIQGRGINDR